MTRSPTRRVLLATGEESRPFAAITECLLAFAREFDWSVHVLAVGHEKARQRIAAWSPDGVIAYAARPTGLRPAAFPNDIPLVAINPAKPVVRAVTVHHDSAETGRLAAHELVALSLDNFAFAAASEHSWVEKRFRAFDGELATLGRRPMRSPLLARRSNAIRWLKTLPRPCGVFAANDAVAELIAVAAEDAGLSVPGEIAILGVDDDERVCEHCRPTLSSIRPDFSSAAREATRALDALLHQHRAPHLISYGDAGVVRRASTRIIRGYAPVVAAALEFIRMNAASDISSADVIASMNLPRRTAETMFHRSVGHSILAEIHSVRLENVKRLLANPALTIAGVAARSSGYSSENFLERLFKRATGLSMRDWRIRCTHGGRHER